VGLFVRIIVEINALMNIYLQTFARISYRSPVAVCSIERLFRGSF
jgi:hypothetical protein